MLATVFATYRGLSKTYVRVSKTYMWCPRLGQRTTTDELPGVDLLARRMLGGMDLVVFMHYVIIVHNGVVMDHNTDYK
jgi:hypothetical protein